MTMLDILQTRLPDGLKVVKSTKRGDWHKLTFAYDGTECAADLRATCVPKDENNICDYTIATAMMAIALKRNDIELCKQWKSFQDAIFNKPKKPAKKICYVTNMTEMPKNCAECLLSEYGCYLPLKSNKTGYMDEIKKQYITKRHKNCPLIEIEGD